MEVGQHCHTYLPWGNLLIYSRSPSWWCVSTISCAPSHNTAQYNAEYCRAMPKRRNLAHVFRRALCTDTEHFVSEFLNVVVLSKNTCKNPASKSRQTVRSLFQNTDFFSYAMNLCLEISAELLKKEALIAWDCVAVGLLPCTDGVHTVISLAAAVFAFLHITSHTSFRHREQRD